MADRIITISREFGSGGREIGKRAAERLGIPFYDKEIIGETAEKTGLAESYIEKLGEYSPRKSYFAYAFSGRNSSGMAVEDYLYATQRKVILDIADRGSCVIVGRCADFILKDRDCLSVFIFGEEQTKQERICRLYGKTEAEARKLMKDMDKRRSLNYGYYTEHEWGRVQNYTMSLNSSKLGSDACVDTICRLF